MIRRRVAFLAPLLIAIALGGCSATGGGAGGTGGTPGSGSTGGTITVTDAWARASTGVGMAGAAYFTISNGTGAVDALLAVTSPAAATAEVHETTQSSDGMMGMHAVTRLEVPAGQTVRLQPGGHHVMLMGLTAELVAGSTIRLTLTFEHAGDITVVAEVRAS